MRHPARQQPGPLRPTRSPTDRAASLALVVLLLLGLAAYGNSLRNGFVIDDRAIILGDARVQGCEIRALLSGPYWPTAGGDLLYRPLLMASFAINWAISHAPWTFRLPNLLLHIAVAVLIFRLVRDWMKSLWPALAAAAWFVVDPIHTSVLNGIVGRAELGATLFGLLALWLWWRDGTETTPRGWRRPIAAAVAFLVATFFKESALPLVGVLLLQDLAGWKPTERTREPGWWGRRFRRCYGPLLLVLLAYFGARWAALGSTFRPTGEIGPVDNIIARPDYGLQPGDSQLLSRWGTPLAVFGRAATSLAGARPLCWDYSYAAIDHVKHLNDPWLIAGALWLVAAGAAMVWSWRRRRMVFLALGILLITYSLVSNTFILIGTVFAERLLYLPSVGFALLAATIWWSCFGFVQERLGRGAAAVLLIVLLTGVVMGTVRTFLRNPDWRSDQTLNAADLPKNPRSARLWGAVATDALNHSAAAPNRQEELTKAVANAEQAVAICPEYGPAWSTAGLAHWQLGESAKALECLDRSFQLGGLTHEQPVVVAADLRRASGNHQGAIDLLKRGAAANPKAASIRNNLACYLLTAEPPTLRDPAAALSLAKSAIDLAPRQGDFIDTYIDALSANGRRAEARQELERLLPTIPPADPYRGQLTTKLAALKRESSGG